VKQQDIFTSRTFTSSIQFPRSDIFSQSIPAAVYMLQYKRWCDDAKNGKSITVRANHSRGSVATR